MTNSTKQQPASLDNMKPLIKKLLELRADKKDIEAEIKEIEGEVKEAIADRGKMQLDEFIFECKTMPGRKTLDKKAVAEFLAGHGADIAEFEKQGAPFMQLNVSEATTVL